ncbi:zf-ZPR1-domain-containing protein [Ascobolus immersus RN42]|uniref:Zf-ZPR1-domain-containing protein n=1 Tax=Ascobolus immersus RN42 TaxID=1160509 RepID=A0A3N4J282_ASCIM|nr:zf-ZPR1-domain-containing protein [Ascobolus immersus RN42]
MSAESSAPKEIVHTNEDFFKKIGDAVETVDKTKDIDDDDEPQVVDRIESLCMNCHEDGETKLFLTRIPFFKEVILMSFYCPHCHFRNNEIQSAGMIQERGVKFVFHVNNKEDMNRQIVKSDSCTCRFEELDLEVPAQRGQLTTVEGLLRTVHDDLALAQESRKEVDPEGYEQVEKFLAKLIQYVNGEKFPMTITVDDPSGNSWVEPSPEDARGKWVRSQYLRSKDQNEFLALAAPGEGEDDQAQQDPVDVDIVPDEVYTFPATCPSCVQHCETHMKTVDIPHFKDVIIMATNCDHCGYKSNEVKTGGAVPTKGRRITLKVQDEEDLARDILKSETCALTCPELNLDLTPGTLGGRFTTVEGLLSQVHDELHARVFAEMDGDSIEPERKQRWLKFFEGLKEAKEGKKKFTLILEDPMASSYLQNLYAPDPDPEMVIEDYERTHEQEEDLGLLDMKTEGYEEQEAIDQAERDAKAKRLADIEMEESKKKAEELMEKNAQ